MIITFRPLVQWIDPHLQVTKPIMTSNLQLEVFWDQFALHRVGCKTRGTGKPGKLLTRKQRARRAWGARLLEERRVRGWTWPPSVQVAVVRAALSSHWGRLRTSSWWESRFDWPWGVAERELNFGVDGSGCVFRYAVSYPWFFLGIGFYSLILGFLISQWETNWTRCTDEDKMGLCLQSVPVLTAMP